MELDLMHLISSIVRSALHIKRITDKCKKDEEEPNKNIKSDFVFYGNGSFSRNFKEYESLNKEEADQAFKKYKREILDSYLTDKGFKKYKTNAYVRLNPNRLVEYIDLQKEPRGSRTFTLNIALFPLYAPQDFMTIGFGDRMGCIISGKDFWWDFKDDETTKISFENVKDGLEQFVMPWFEHYCYEKNYESDLMNHKYLIGCDDIIIWPTLLYIRQNNITRAKEYLKSTENYEFFLDDNKKLIPMALSALNDMKKLLSENTDFDKYFSETENAVIEKFKLPKRFKVEK